MTITVANSYIVFTTCQAGLWIVNSLSSSYVKYKGRKMDKMCFLTTRSSVVQLTRQRFRWVINNFTFVSTLST